MIVFAWCGMLTELTSLNVLRRFVKFYSLYKALGVPMCLFGRSRADAALLLIAVVSPGELPYKQCLW